MSVMQLLVKVLASCCSLSNLCLLCRGRRGTSALLNDDGILQHVDDLPEVDDVDANGGQIVPRAGPKRTPLNGAAPVVLRSSIILFLDLNCIRTVLDFATNRSVQRRNI